MLADLLFEKGNYPFETHYNDIKSENCLKKSFIIYTFLKEHATLNYSLDMHYKLEILSNYNF